MNTIAWLLHRPAREVLALLVAVTLLVALAPSTAEAAKPLKFRAWLGDSCVSGHGPQGAKITVVWKAKDGRIKQKATLRTNNSGDWRFCGDGSERVRKDDIITARKGSTSRSVTVPAMRVVADRDTDHVTGKGPKSSRLVIQVCEWRTFKKGRCGYKSITTASDGTFDQDFSTGTDDGPAMDIRGGDRVMAFTPLGDGQKDLFGRDIIAPFIDVLRGRARFAGTATVSGNVTAQLWAAADPYGTMKDAWSGRADHDFWVARSVISEDLVVRISGIFRGRFADAEGDLIRVRTGDRIVAPKLGSDADFIVPGITVSVDKTTDVVSGSCLAERPFRVYAQNPSGSKWAMRKGTAASDGSFSRDLTKALDVKRGHPVWLSCALSSGDVVTRRAVAE